MEYTYIKFESSKAKKAKLNIFQKFLLFIFPAANPDFDNHVGNVTLWLLELDTEGNFTNREIGIDEFNKPIVIVPWKKNFGYWVDSDMKYEDYISHFNVKKIEKEEFESRWKEFGAPS